MDRNEGACGACRRIGELICCEGCVAAYHVRCAGYGAPVMAADNPSEVPDGDWYCWFCAKKKGLQYQHPNTLLKAPRTQQTPVMLAVDDKSLDRFHRCLVLSMSEKYAELTVLDGAKREVVPRNSNRLWHGTVDKNAWSIEADGVTWRPNSRLFELDTEATRIGDKAARSHQHQPRSRDSRQQPSSKPSVDARGIQRVPEGEIGAGLPVIQGGAGQDEFMTALNGLWRNLLGSGYPERMPQCLLMPGHPVEPWYLWREVWSWGGPDVVTENKLWATVGFSFPVQYSSSAATSRIKKSYDLLLAPLDQAIDAGDVNLQRPPKCRVLKHRALQIRPPIVPGSGPSPAVAAAARRSHVRPKGRSKKRKRGAWSSSDDDEPAPDFGSEFESGDELMNDAVSGSDDDGSMEDGSSSESDEQQSEEEQESSELGDQGTPPARRPQVVGGVRPAAAASGGGRVRTQQQAETEVMGRVLLTPAALKIKVGDVVDFRQIQPAGNCATGWRSGTVLAIEPGSPWEGRWLLIKPRHHHHTKPQPQQGLKPLPDSPAAAVLAAVTAAGCEGSAAHAAQKLLTPSGRVRHEVAGLIPQPVKPGSPGGAKPGQHQSAVVGLGAGDSAAVASTANRESTAAAAAAAAAGGDTDRPCWVPMVWRGSYSSPFPRPLVMVRPHYSAAAAAAAATASQQLVSSGSSQQFKSPQQQEGSVVQQQQQAGLAMDRQQSVSSIQSVSTLQLSQLTVGAAVEVLREGSWWPAKVVSVKGPGQEDDKPGSAARPAAAAGASLSEAPLASGPSQMSLSAAGSVGLGANAVCVVLRNDDAPEADGAVWRCSSGHPMRPAHPQQSSSFGMLQSRRGNMMLLPAVRKQLQPYTYAGNIQAFACLHHLRPEFGRA